MAHRSVHPRISSRLFAALWVSLTLATSAAASPPEDLQLELVTGGLDRPVAVRHAGDGSGRLFIVEQPGRIRVYDGTQLLATPFLDLTAQVDASGGEQGLLGLAFHPDYEGNGFFYVNYTRDPGPGPDRTVVARYQVSMADADVANPASGVTLLEVAQDFANHNGGNLLFGPDGYLYIGLGDGGSAGDPNDRAQDLTTLLGKMLRIDVDSSPPPAPNDLCGLVSQYGIPADNPFAGGNGDCDEIWSFGLRNPWRWSFDRRTGDLLIGDVGQDQVEEINFQAAASTGGENWGWRCYEGSEPFNLAGCPGALAFPILEYSHGAPFFHCSVTAGYRYRGKVIGALQGLYLYGDFCSGHVWYATQNGATWTSQLWMVVPYNISSFGEDEAGELYLVHHGGQVLRFRSPSSLFHDGFETGDAAAWSAVN